MVNLVHKSHLELRMKIQKVSSEDLLEPLLVDNDYMFGNSWKDVYIILISLQNYSHMHTILDFKAL